MEAQIQSGSRVEVRVQSGNRVEIEWKLELQDCRKWPQPATIDNPTGCMNARSRLSVYE